MPIQWPRKHDKSRLGKELLNRKKLPKKDASREPSGILARIDGCVHSFLFSKV